MGLMRLAALGIGLVVVSAVLGGCLGSDIPPRLPALFHIDEIRYWWEGEYLIVNVTFTNQHQNYTPGIGGLSPEITVSLYQEKVLEKDGGIGQETERVHGEAGTYPSINLEFNTQFGQPWQDRWNRSTTTGPMLIPPGRTLSAEFKLKPQFDYKTTSDGYYHMDVDMPSWYPQSFFSHKFQGQENAEYVTGCFNRVVPEFYGAKNGAPDCSNWDCTGLDTRTGYHQRDVVERYRPDCNATKHTGPNYK